VVLIFHSHGHRSFTYITDLLCGFKFGGGVIMLILYQNARLFLQT
jgi:hypothetical protein